MKNLYIIIWEISFLCVALTLTLTMVDYTDTLNELKNITFKIHYLFILFSFLFKNFQKTYTYNKKWKLYKVKKIMNWLYVYIRWFHKKRESSQNSNITFKNILNNIKYTFEVINTFFISIFSLIKNINLYIMWFH